ncbi:hypothetical protein X733_30180 [Mesorhizobium sp. L2C067A000]|nr:hypothetical protein X733_30180 [Mesorhizobium sp. L2C067A000]
MVSNGRGLLSKKCTRRSRNKIDSTATLDSVTATPTIT